MVDVTFYVYHILNVVLIKNENPNIYAAPVVKGLSHRPEKNSYEIMILVCKFDALDLNERIYAPLISRVDFPIIRAPSLFMKHFMRYDNGVISRASQ